MIVTISNGFVIALFGLYTFICVLMGLYLGSNMIAKNILKHMHMNLDRMISKEEKSIRRTNLKEPEVK